MVSLLANIGIIFLAFYFYLRSKLGILAYQENRKISYFIKCVFAEVLLGMILLSFSIVIMDIRFDFRFLLFCFSAKYLDWKITSSSIVLLAILRFFLGLYRHCPNKSFGQHCDSCHITMVSSLYKG